MKHKIVREAYLFGYPLVTMDMTRRHETNVRVPKAIEVRVFTSQKTTTAPRRSKATRSISPSGIASCGPRRRSRPVCTNRRRPPHPAEPEDATPTARPTVPTCDGIRRHATSVPDGCDRRRRDVGRPQVSRSGSRSTFTSRNVRTLTLGTKRAGRYMSHTQASVSSTSMQVGDEPLPDRDLHLVGEIEAPFRLDHVVEQREDRAVLLDKRQFDVGLVAFEVLFAHRPTGGLPASP